MFEKRIKKLGFTCMCAVVGFALVTSSANASWPTVSDDKKSSPEEVMSNYKADVVKKFEAIMTNYKAYPMLLKANAMDGSLYRVMVDSYRINEQKSMQDKMERLLVAQKRTNSLLSKIIEINKP